MATNPRACLGYEAGVLAVVHPAGVKPRLGFLLPSDILLPPTLPSNVQVDGAFKIPGLRIGAV